MFEEHILTDIKVKKDKLFIHIRDKGNVYINWEHTFPTRILSDIEKRKLLEELEKDPILSGYFFREGGKRRTALGKQIFNNIHIDLPIYLKNYLKENYPTNKYSSQKRKTQKEKDVVADIHTEQNKNSSVEEKKPNSIFLFGDYTNKAQEKFCVPSSLAWIESDTLETIVINSKFNKQIKELRKEIQTELKEKNKGKSYQTRVFNELEKLFVKEQTGQQRNKEIQTNTYTKNLSEKIINKRKRTLSTYNQLVKQSKKINARLELDSKTKTLDVVLQNTDNITPIQPISYERMLEEKWLFFDIEIPLFASEKESEISWVGMTYIQPKGKNKQESKIKKEIHTLRDLGQQTFKKYKIIHYENESELVKGVAKSIQKENPYVTSSYNAKFDFLKLRDAGEFVIGLNEKRPYQDVSISFFERIGLEGRELIDLLRWAQIAYDYLPNRKLELVSRTTLPQIYFTKSLTYDEMADKERIAKYNPDKKIREKMAQEIAEYLIGDVDIMPELFFSQEFQSSLEIACDISTHFNIPFSNLLYSQRAINKIQERSYFEAIGIPRDQVLYRTKKSRDKVSKAKQEFKTLLKANNFIDTPAGIYSNVHVGYLKYGLSLSQLIKERLPQTKILFDRKPKTGFENHLLGRYMNGLAEWVTADYAILKKLEKKYIKKVQELNQSESYINTTYVNQQIKFSENKTAQNQFNRGSVSVKTLKNNLGRTTKEFMEKTNLNEKQFIEFMDQKRRYLKFRTLFRTQYSINESRVEKILSKQLLTVQKFAKKSNLKIIHQEGPYIYFSGNAEEIKKQYPSLFIASFDKVLITREHKPTQKNNRGEAHIYYNTYGTFKGLKLVDHATNIMNLFEQESIGSFITNSITNNPIDAITTLEEKTNELFSQKIKKEHLVWYSKGKDRYSAYENGEKIYFYTQKPEEISSEEIFKDEVTGRKYIKEEIRNKENKTYIMQINEFKPDWNMYEKKYSKDAKNITGNILEEQTDNLLTKPEEATLFSSFNKQDAIKKLVEKYYS